MRPSPRRSPGSAEWSRPDRSNPRRRRRPRRKPALRPVRGPRGSGGAASGIVATLALLFWKFKFLAVVLLTKGKLLLLGLTKASTFFSMFLTVGLFWTEFGLWFAVGLVLSVYVHEMGHVFALTRYGIRAEALMFVPGLGAYVRFKHELTDPMQDARVGLAGPIWGLGAALVCLAAFALTRQPIWAALAQFGGAPESIEPSTDLAPRWRACLSQPDPFPALARRGGNRSRLGRHRHGVTGPALGRWYRPHRL